MSCDAGLGLWFAEDAEELGGGVGEAGTAAGDEIDVAGHVHLADFEFFHPAVLNFPLHAHARNDGYAHAHLHEALDAFDGGHFDGHFEGGAIFGEELDDAAAKGGFDAMGDEVLAAEFFDVHLALFGESVLGRDDESELIGENFGGLKLRLLGDVRDGADVQTVIQDFVRNVAGEHAVDAHQRARMQLAETGEGGQKSVDGAFVDAER